MSDLTQIKKVAGFAGKEEAISPCWSQVHFKKGLCFAAQAVGGAAAKIDSDVEGSVSASALLRALKAVGDDATFDVEGGEFILRGSKGSKAKIPLSPAKDQPPLPALPDSWAEVSGLDGIAKVVWCASDDFSRPHLCNVHFGARGVTATNGHALAECSGPNVFDQLGSEILALPMLFKGSEDVAWLGNTPTHLFVADDPEQRFYRFAQTCDQKFPPVSKFFDDSVESVDLTFDREGLADLVKRSQFGNTTLVLSFKGNLLSIHTPEGDVRSKFSFECSIPFEGPAFAEKRKGEKSEAVECCEIGFSADYLLPLITANTESKVVLRIQKSAPDLSPLLVYNGALAGVVMPIRL